MLKIPILNNRFDDVPVMLIIYELNNIEKFIDSSDKDLIAREDGALGKDKIDSMRLQKISSAISSFCSFVIFMFPKI